MRKLVGFLLMSVFTFSAFAQQKSIQWYTINEAMELNKKEPRKMLFDVYTTWCYWCKVMDKKTFTDPQVIDYINNNFYAIKLNAESKDTIAINNVRYVNPNNDDDPYHQLAIHLLKGQMAFPSITYANENNEYIAVVPGYWQPADMLNLLKYIAEGKYEQTSWQDYQASTSNK